MGLRKAATFLLALVLVASWARPLTAASSDKIDRLQKEIEQTQKESERIQNRARETQSKLSQVRKQQQLTAEELNRLSAEIDSTQNRLAEVEAELARAEERLAATTAELQQAEKTLADRTELLHRRVRAIYEHGALTYLDVLLAANSFNDFLTRFENLERVVAGDVRLFYEVRAWRADVSAKKAKQEQERAQVAAVKQQVEQAKISLEEQKGEREQVYQRLLSDRQALERELDKLDELSRQLESRIQSLSKELEKELNVQGALILNHPMPGAPVTSPFGMRVDPILGTRRMHTGIDYAAPYGKAIKAVEAGKVIQAGWLGGYGKAVIIFHGKGVSTLYGHMSQINVETGQMVRKGDVIGLVGSTGLSTGPHLHFEVRIDGVPRDPAAYIGRPIM